MLNLPNLRQLQYLIALHKHQHFGKAAQACFISQSTLSAAIQQLEALMQCQLLERSHKSFIFTALGEQVVIDAKALVQSGADLLQYTRSQSQPMAGIVVLGCIPTIAPFVLSQVARDCARAYPDLQLMLKEDTSENLVAALAAGEVDMVILALPYSTEGFSQLVLAEDRLNLVVHQQLGQQYLTSDVAQLPAQSIFLLQQDHCLAEHTQTLCNLIDVSKINPFLATSVQTLVQMVDAHQGVTFLPQMAINSDILNGTDLLVRLSDAPAHRNIGVIWRSSSRCVDTYQQLAEIIKVAVKAKCQA